MAKMTSIFVLFPHEKKDKFCILIFRFLLLIIFSNYNRDRYVPYYLSDFSLLLVLNMMEAEGRKTEIDRDTERNNFTLIKLKETRYFIYIWVVLSEFTKVKTALERVRWEFLF